MRAWSTRSTTDEPSRRRFRDRRLPIIPCRLPAENRTALPEPDTLNRLAAARLVFILGIGWISSRRSRRHAGLGSLVRGFSGRLLRFRLHTTLGRLRHEHHGEHASLGPGRRLDARLLHELGDDPLDQLVAVLRMRHLATAERDREL